MWQHTVYLGVYELEAIYDRLHRAFGEDTDAYDERPAGLSACAGVLLDGRGALVPDSAVLPSALWAVGRIEKGGEWNRAWAEGFSTAARGFMDAVDEHEGGRRQADDLETAPAHDAGSLIGLLRAAHEASGITGMPDLATDYFVVQSVVRSACQGDDAADSDLLNSFSLDDLAAVHADVSSQGRCGVALGAYLTNDSSLTERQRVDVMIDHASVDADVTVDRLPKGRWPSRPERGLALRQQFAVNQALGDFAPTRGLLGVNGPPGTGKTTMLRDILAGNIVERATRSPPALRLLVTTANFICRTV